MSVEQIRSHAQRYSKSYGRDSSPWKTNEEGMSIKTPLKLLLSKYGALSVDWKMQRAIEADQSVTTDLEGEKLTYPDGNDVNNAVDAELVKENQPSGDAQES